jgi:hypothetical protein
MSICLRNPRGETFVLSAGHWAVYLTLAEAYGWKPAGTSPPRSHPGGDVWSGRYDSSDGQTVGDADAKLLAQVLHAAAVSAKLGTALSDVIAYIERQVENAGTPIPPQMRLDPHDFSKEFSPLLMFLYQGTFVIE